MMDFWRGLPPYAKLAIVFALFSTLAMWTHDGKEHPVYMATIGFTFAVILALLSCFIDDE